MNIEEIVDRYTDAARAHTRAMSNFDYKEANRQHDIIIDTLHLLRDSGNIHALMPLLSDKNPGVRCWAATHLLFDEPASASIALEEVSREGGIVGHGALIVLREWRKGTLRIP